MGFANEHLNSGEELILNFKPHWKCLVPAFFWTVLIGMALGALMWLTRQSWSALVPWLIGVAAIAWVFIALPVVVRWMTTEIVLTDERLVTRRGLIRRVTYDIPVDQINSITVHQGLIERLLRAGNLVVESASDTGDQVIHDVPRPTDVQNTISRAKDSRNSERASQSGGPGGASVSERLAELDDLYDRGLVTDVEFSQKRADLLRGL